jgi:hypothetical protein
LNAASVLCLTGKAAQRLRWKGNSIALSIYLKLLGQAAGEIGDSFSITTIITELYDALKDAGADEEKARNAAETVAADENRFAKIDTDFAIVDGWSASNRRPR